MLSSGSLQSWAPTRTCTCKNYGERVDTSIVNASFCHKHVFLKNVSSEFHLVGVVSINTVGGGEHMLVRDQGSSTVANPDNPGELVRDGLLSTMDPHSGWSVRNSAIAIGS